MGKYQRYVDGKPGRIGKAIPTAEKFVPRPRHSGKNAKASVDLHRRRSQGSPSRHATPGLRSIQRALDTGKPVDYRHRGLDREGAAAIGKTGERRSAARAIRLELEEYRRLALDAFRRRKREMAIVRKMHRDFVRLDVTGYHLVAADV